MLKLLGHRLLTLFNCVLYRQEGIVSTIPKQRLVFFVKHGVSQCHGSLLAEPACTEILRALVIILPVIGDLYGDFWEGTLSTIRDVWSNVQSSNESDIPLINVSLRLLSVLRSLAAQESNDDLQEALDNNTALVSEGLIGLMSHSQGTHSLL